MMEAEECCQICVDVFTKHARKPIVCDKCQFTCCTVCFKQHCLTGSDPMCMNPDCRTLFKEEFLYKNLSASFIKGDLRKKRKETLFEREKAMMERTMPLLEATIVKENAQNRKKEILEEMQLQLREQEELIRESDAILRGEQEKQEEGVKRKTYLKKCPTKDCHGFLNSQYNCELCKKSTCSKCFETKEEGHVCNEDTLKTAEMLKNDTKSCPQCGEMIHKSYGCDQMYCISCHTVFSWNTGKITTGVVHNPHYFEYLRRNNGHVDRNVLDIPCGGLPNMMLLESKIIELFGNRTENYKKYYSEIERIYQFAAELREIIADMNTGQDRFNSTLNIRMKYMRKGLDDEGFKKQIIRNDSLVAKNAEIVQVYNTLAVLIEDQLRNITIATSIDNILVDALPELRRIVDYTNNIFKEMAKTFKVKMPMIIYPILKIVVEGRFGYLNYNNRRENRLIIQKTGTSY